MITARKILSAFYDAQGLNGNHLRKAIQSDLRSIRRQGGKPENARGGALVNCGFAWGDSKEGGLYWARRAMFYRPMAEARQVN